VSGDAEKTIAVIAVMSLSFRNGAARSTPHPKIINSQEFMHNIFRLRKILIIHLTK
jgi:hypothetical protein